MLTRSSLVRSPRSSLGEDGALRAPMLFTRSSLVRSPRSSLGEDGALRAPMLGSSSLVFDYSPAFLFSYAFKTITKSLAGAWSTPKSC